MSPIKKIVALTAATLLTATLTACGGSTPPTNNTSGETGNSLTVWAWDPTFNVYAMKEAAKVYQKDHPDFSLNVVEIKWDDLQAKFTTLGQSGQTDQLPDIFLMQNNAFQKNVLSYPDMFADYDKAGVDFSQYPASVVNYSTVDGHNYGLPFDNGAAIAAYRTDVLEQAGYSIKDFTDITWDEFTTKAKDVLAKTGKPLLSGQAGTADMIMMMLQSAGASLFDKEGHPTIVDNDALIKVIDTYKGLLSEGVFQAVNTWDEYIGTFVNDSVAGVVNGCWILGSIQSANDQSGKWGITDLPKLTGLSSATNYSANGGSSWAISANANYDLAADFLKATFAGSTDLYETILPSSGALANWLPAGKSQAYAQPQPFFDNEAIYTKIVDYAAKAPSNNTGAYYYEALAAVSAAVTKVTSGTDLATALQEAQNTVEFAMK
ncbi:MAG: hypothetical protein LBV00_00755 [Propionibacteriaceae bacterium]|jgi:lactose/L-arabinose transport system substrate-binding protein|nr:hypothetical protein [Propionibacteriaceae bacterium]